MQDPPLPALNIAALAKGPDLGEHTSKDTALTGSGISGDNYAADGPETSETGTEDPLRETTLAGQKPKAKVNNTIVRGYAALVCK